MMKTTKWTVMLLVLMLLGWQATGWAADKKYLLSEHTYKALDRAQQLMEKNNYNQAEQDLKELLGETKSGSYDHAMVEQTLGYLYSSKEQYQPATAAFKRALDSGALPDKVAHNLRYNMAQLLLADGEYKQGISEMEAWLDKEPKPSSDTYVMLASAYYQIKNYHKVIANMQMAIKRDNHPKEDWYRMLLSAYLQLKEYKSAIGVLETLITQYPYKKDYWDQLTALYQQQSKEFTSLAVRVLAQKLDLGNDKTLLSLADMYRYLQIPFKAATLLKQGMDNGVIETNYDNLEKLAQSWLAARETEKAAAVLEQMVPLDKTGTSDLKLGQVYVSMEKWEKAVTALSKSLAKLKGNDVGKANLLLGMAYFHIGKPQKATNCFNKAVGFKAQRNQAAQWLHYLEQLNSNQDKKDAA